MTEPLTSPLVSRCAGVRHGFAASPAGIAAWRPRQVHGATVVEPGRADAAMVPADAVVARRGGPMVGVVTADCVPLLCAAEGGGAVAAVHAGWRGLAAGVVEAAVERLRTLARGRRLIAAVGPAAGGCCYEVGPEVIAAVQPAPAHVIPGQRGRPRLDLRAVAVDRLLAAGLHADGIEVVGPCSICHAGWPSYRRDGEQAGRALAFIEPAAETAPGGGCPGPDRSP